MKPGNKGQSLVISLIGLLFLGPTAFAQTTHVVTVGDNFFSPSSLTINVGDTVEWRNASGGMPHDVTANDGSFASQTASSFTFSVTFDEPGTFSYLCTVHPADMTGVITVQGVATAAELDLEEVSVAPGSYPQGSMISIDAEVRNTGNAASGAFTIRHYASVNSVVHSISGCGIVNCMNKPDSDWGRFSDTSGNVLKYWFRSSKGRGISIRLM